MTRPAIDVEEVLELGRRRLSPTEIARRTGIPRRTVHGWLREPRSRRRGASRDTCRRCGHAAHCPERLPSRYPGVIDEVANSIGSVRPGNAVARAGKASNYGGDPAGPKTSIEVSSYSRAWPCLIPQYGPGRKHERTIRLADWQRELVERDPRPLLRGLIHSDGCRFVNTGRGGWSHPRYSFTNYSDGIRAIFCDACDLLGLHWTVAKRTIYVSRKADVARMDEFIGPKA